VHFAHAALQFPHAQLPGNRFVGERQRTPLIVECGQGARVTGTQSSLLDDLEDDGRQLKNSQHLRDGRAILAHRVRDLLVREAEFFGEATIASRLFDRIQVGALQVFDEREREERAIVDVAHDRRDVRPPQPGRSAEPSLARDQLETIRGATNRDRLQQA